ncbi:MAG: hypothetical protein EAZ61_09825 [Oscillatoriales cyanobacterium]|nr:MAG: hypothetical protein EAZ61_09825 [Oscillatoriales cyanobacterium]
MTPETQSWGESSFFASEDIDNPKPIDPPILIYCQQKIRFERSITCKEKTRPAKFYVILEAQTSSMAMAK